MSTPRITVLLSMHDAARYVRAAVESVLAQSWRDFECIVIDDASTDDSAAIVEALGDPRIRILRQRENIGLTRCLNRGLREARGEFVARQDADDLSSPERFARQVAFLDAHPEVPLVGTQARLVDQHGHSRGSRDLPLDPGGIRWLSLFDNPVIHTAAMFRTAVVRDELGGYDESFPCCQDYALWARVLERYPVSNLPEHLVTVREHDASVSATRGAEARAMVRRVVRRLADAWLPALALGEGDVDLLCRFRSHLAPEEVAPFHALEARLWRECVTHFPHMAADPDALWARAAMSVRIGYNLLTRDRFLAASEVLRAVRTWPAVAADLPWARMLALFVLGDNARKLFERARRR